MRDISVSKRAMLQLMPVDWEDRYQVGDTPWDKGAPHPALVDFLREETPLRGNILVPGCGYGYDVRAITREDNHVVGIDIAPSAIRGAEAFSKITNERYELADLFNLPQRHRGDFDWVWEHTCFCAIDPEMRTHYVDAVADALKPGGHLLAAFYLKPDLAEGEQGPPFGVTIPKLDGLFHRHFELLREWIPARTYEGREERELIRLLQKRQ